MGRGITRIWRCPELCDLGWAPYSGKAPSVGLTDHRGGLTTSIVPSKVKQTFKLYSQWRSSKNFSGKISPFFDKEIGKILDFFFFFGVYYNFVYTNTQFFYVQILPIE